MHFLGDSETVPCALLVTLPSSSRPFLRTYLANANNSKFMRSPTNQEPTSQPTTHNLAECFKMVDPGHAGMLLARQTLCISSRSFNFSVHNSHVRGMGFECDLRRSMPLYLTRTSCPCPACFHQSCLFLAFSCIWTTVELRAGFISSSQPCSSNNPFELPPRSSFACPFC